MHAGKLSAIGIGIALGLAVVFLVDHETASIPPTSVPEIRFADAPEFDDSRYRSKTFSLAIADLNGDYRDDILIGAHNQNPFLLINQGAGFTDQSHALFSTPRRDDRHGYTLADLDNDGRLDITIASGGTDGVGGGWPNLLLRNESEGEDLRFVAQPMAEDFALQPGRSRTFIPAASADGSTVDLYYTTLERDGYKNRFFRNNGGALHQALTPDAGHFLSRRINDQGRGVLADLDDDGGVDYITVERDTARIFWNRDGGHKPTDLLGAVRTLLVADFNNDGRLDIFVGRANRQTRSDRMTFASDGMIFTLHKNSENDISEATFQSDSSTLSFDLNQWVPLDRAERLETTDHIFLGRDRVHPAKRRFSIDKEETAGEPDAPSKPGIYIWFNTEKTAWRIRWVSHPNLDVIKGIISGTGLQELDRQGFHIAPGKTVRDQLFLNKGEGRFTRQDLSTATHSSITQGATAADFNNDGWIDILGVRHGDQGDAGIAPFLLTNLGLKSDGQLEFRESSMPMRERDRLHRSDQVAHGFFDDDDRPDAIVTNGFGQIPGTDGVPRLLLNATEGAGDSMLLSLQGDASNRFGLGAMVRLYTGSELLGYRVAGLNINVSQDTGWLHFGLGDAEGPYTARVEWPDATVTKYELAEGGRYLLEQAGNTRPLSP